MCKQTNKCLFAAGIGLHFLVYFCATNFAEIKVINGKGKGSALKEVHKLDRDYIEGFIKNEVFLDNTTGDYYVFKKETELWTPKGNVGLHYSKASVGPLLKKVQTYKPKGNPY